jgi:hypothetical protein
MRNHLKKFVVTAIVFAGLMSLEVFAPPTGGPGGVGGSGATCWPPPCIPIDGGIGFLLVAGAAFAGRKLLAVR